MILNFQVAILDFGGHFEFGAMDMKKISYFNSLTLKTYKNVKIVHLHINWGKKNANFLSGGHLGRHLEYFENEATNSLPLTSSGFSMFQSTIVPNLALLSKSAQFFALTALLKSQLDVIWMKRLIGSPLYQCLCWAYKRLHTWAKCVTCCGLLLFLITSSINPR